MCVGTATAITLGVTAASAGASLAGAKMASNASKNAAATQSAAADKALAAQQQGYQQQRQDFSPYLQAGTAALGRLGQTAGTYTGGMPKPQAPLSPPMGGMGQLGAPSPQMPGQTPVTMPQVGAVPQQPGTGGPMPGSLVKVQAPTGQVAMLPQDVAQRAVAAGAKIVN